MIANININDNSMYIQIDRFEQSIESIEKLRKILVIPAEDSLDKDSSIAPSFYCYIKVKRKYCTIGNNKQKEKSNSGQLTIDNRKRTFTVFQQQMSVCMFVCILVSVQEVWVNQPRYFLSVLRAILSEFLSFFCE